MPIFIIAAPFSLYFLHTGDASSIQWSVSSIVTSSLIIYLLVNIPIFLFIGEAERYINHVAFFSLISFSIFSHQSGIDWLPFTALLYGFLFWLFEILLMIKMRRSKWDKIEEIDLSIINNLDTEPQPHVVLCYPYGAVGVWRILLETKNSVIMPYTLSGETLKHFEENWGAEYPYARLDKIDEMAKMVQLDYLIVYKKRLKERGYDSWTPSNAWEKQDIGEPIYLVYKYNPSSKHNSLTT